MTDVHSPEQRRRNMQAIRSRDTQQEQRLRSALRKAGLTGYRTNLASLPGRPDVAYTRWRVAIFLDGCFWHVCPKCHRPPATNTEFWEKKLARNQERDAEVVQELESRGWTVLRFWEHQVETELDNCIAEIYQALRSSGR